MAHRDSPFDLDKLRIDPTDPSLVPRQGAPKKKTAKKWKRQYVRVPWSWIERLQASKSIGAYRLALFLAYEHWRNGGKPIELTNATTTNEGVPRSTKWRSLLELERLGLVRIRHRNPKSPLVYPLLDDPS